MQHNEEIKLIAASTLEEYGLPKSFCILPWIGTELRTNGEVGVCCVTTDIIDGVSLQTDTITTVLESDSLKEIKQSFRDGVRRPGCNNCFAEERSGIVSKREAEIHRNLDIFEDIGLFASDATKLRYIDVKLGNVCNSKCRICSNFSSSKWFTEEQIVFKSADPELNKLGKWPSRNLNFWSDLSTHLDNVKYLEFFGGEPLLIQEHKEVLKLCVQKGIAHNISISYNTNGTIYDNGIINLWKEFKHVQLLISTDGVGERFEYLRYPAKWNAVNDNIHRYIDAMPSLVVGFFCTISAFNIWYLPEICQWAESEFPQCQLHFNKLFNPKHNSPKTLPNGLKHDIKEHLSASKYYSMFSPWVEFMFEDQFDEWSKHTQYRDASDRYRGESFKVTFNEFWQKQQPYTNIITTSEE